MRAPKAHDVIISKFQEWGNCPRLPPLPGAYVPASVFHEQDTFRLHPMPAQTSPTWTSLEKDGTKKRLMKNVFSCHNRNKKTALLFNTNRSLNVGAIHRKKLGPSLFATKVRKLSRYYVRICAHIPKILHAWILLQHLPCTKMFVGSNSNDDYKLWRRMRLLFQRHSHR